MEWVVAKVETKKQDDILVWFRVAMHMMFTCSHKGQIFHYKA